MTNPPTNAGTVDNIADLKAIPSPIFKSVFVNGYHTPGDGGGGLFHWDSSNDDSDNGGTIIKPDSIPSGRWIRTLSKPLNVLWFGAKPDLTRYAGCSITTVTPTLTGTFGTSVAVGMAVVVWGAGPGGTDLLTTVEEVIDSNQLKLATNAGTTVTNASAWIGTDNAAAFGLATAASPRDIYVPPGRYGFQNLDDNGSFRGFGIELTQVGHRIFGAMPMDLNIGTYPFGSTHTALYAMGPMNLIRNAAFAGISQVVENLYLECLLQVGNTARADANTAIGINFGYTGTDEAASRYSAPAGLQSQILGVAIKGFREGVRIGDPQIPTQSWGVTLDRVKCYANLVNFRISDMGTEAALSGTQQSIATACTAMQSDGRWLSPSGGSPSDRYAREVIGVQQMGGFWQWNQLRAESNHINFKLKSRPSGQQGQATLIQPSVEGAFSAIFEADSNVGLTVKGGYGSFSRGGNAAITTTVMVRVNQQDSQQNVNPSNISVEDFQLTDGVWSFGDKPRVILFTGKGYGGKLVASVSGGKITAVKVDTAGGVPGGVPLSGEGYSGSETVQVKGDVGSSGGAVALQVLNGRIVGGTVISGGSGYATPPTLTVDGGSGARGTAVICSGATFSVTLAGAAISSITPLTAGTNYFIGQALTISGTGVNATAEVGSVDSNGGVLTVNVTSDGSGYTGTPTASIPNGVTAINLDPDAKGSNYLTPPIVVVDNVTPVTTSTDFTAEVSNGALTGFTRNKPGAGYTVGTTAPRTAKKAGTSLVRIEAPQGVVTSPANVWVERLICTDLLDMTNLIIPASSATYPRFAPKRVSIVAGPSAASLATPLVYEWGDNRQGPTVIQGGVNNRVLPDIGNEISLWAASNGSFYTGYVGLLTTGTGFKTIATIVAPPNTAPSNQNCAGLIRIEGYCRYGNEESMVKNYINWTFRYQRISGVWAIDPTSGPNESGETVTGGQLPVPGPILQVTQASDVLSIQAHRASATATADFYNVTIKHISTQPRTMKIGPS